MRNEFDDYKLTAEEIKEMLERDEPKITIPTTDEKIEEMQNQIKILDESITALILDNLS